MTSDTEHSDEPYRKRKKLPHEIPWWVPDDVSWFITINCDPPSKPQLCQGTGPDPTAEAVLSAARFYHEMKSPKWFVHLFLLMPDHLHAILSFPPGTQMKPTIQAWKRYVKRHHHILWQGDFFDHRLRDQKAYAEKMTYIRMNPVRKGLCDSPKDWQHVLSFDPLTGKETSF